MVNRTLAAVALLLIPGALSAQVPEDLEGRFIFRLGSVDAGWEEYSVKRINDGYRLLGSIELSAMGLRVVQQVAVDAGPNLQFRKARVHAVVNFDTVDVELSRLPDAEFQRGTLTDYGFQKTTTNGETREENLATPSESVLLTSNVIHHLVQFAWLFEGNVGVTVEFTAFPRVPVEVTLEHLGPVTNEDETLLIRRFNINLGDRLGVYVWMAEDGTPLKIFVPMQAFWAVSQGYEDWADLLTPGGMGPAPGIESDEPYDSEEVRFDSGAISLAGTLTTPQGEGPWAAAVLITGSGAQDRDENTPGPGGLKLGIFRSIADTLTRRGIAVLRCDDRGVGGSGGSLATAGLSDLVADVESAVLFLRGRSEIDDARIALVGHSEGAIIAPIVAADDSRVAAIVLMAGTALPLDEVIADQFVDAARSTGGDSADLAAAREMAVLLAEATREGRDLGETELPPAVQALGANRSWLLQHMEHDPQATIRQVRAPVLVVNGAMDFQIPPRHAELLGEALADAGHPDFEVRIFPNLNHLFAVSKGQGAAEYADPSAHVDEEFLTYLADWLTDRLGVS
jgi:alpha-beta hydrolase superfamily lysophospholipase